MTDGAGGDDLTVLKIRPGLWRWTAPHPEWNPSKGGHGGWGRMVGSVYYEASGAVVLVDPLAPPQGSRDAERFWAALDADVERNATKVVVLVSNRYHGRSAATVQARYAGRWGCEVWAHEAARGHVACPLTHTFRDGRGLPAGVRPYSLSGLGPDEVAFFLPEHRTLVVADALLGAGGGVLRLAPRSWAGLDAAGRAAYEAWFRSEIRGLLDLPVDMVLVSHGEPALANGRQAIVDALASPAWGE